VSSATASPIASAEGSHLCICAPGWLSITGPRSTRRLCILRQGIEEGEGDVRRAHHHGHPRVRSGQWCMSSRVPSPLQRKCKAEIALARWHQQFALSCAVFYVDALQLPLLLIPARLDSP
jgi:hypothetical protein